MINSGLITLDTFKPRQNSIIRNKPKDIPYTKLLGTREADDPSSYMERNEILLRTNKEIMDNFLAIHTSTTIITNFYFALLPSLREMIQEHQTKIARVLVVTCQDNFYREHAIPKDLPLQKGDVIAYSDDHGWRIDDLKTTLGRK